MSAPAAAIPPLDRLKRANKLEALRPNNPVALATVAESALEARELSLARSKAEAAARIQPSEGIFLLLADIEEADTGDDGRIRHWMNQALKSPRDPAWTADGVTAPEWLPVSPVSGRLDAFEWKQPVGQIAGPVEEGTLDAADAAIRSLPPVAIVHQRARAAARTGGSRRQPNRAGGRRPRRNREEVASRPLPCRRRPNR